MAHTRCMLDKTICTHAHAHAHAPGQPHVRMHARTRTQTNTCYLFTATVILERASVLRYTYIASLVMYKVVQI